MTDEIARLRELIAKATPGPFEYRIGDDLNSMRQVPVVIGEGLIGRSCIARHADDPEGHADAELHTMLRNAAPALLDRLEAQAKRIGELEKDAARYRWLRATASLRFDCGGWVIGFENWLPAGGDYPRTPEDEPVQCEPTIIDAAVDAAMQEGE